MIIKAEKRKRTIKQIIACTALVVGMGSAGGYAAKAREITALPNTISTSIKKGKVVSNEEIAILDMGNHKYTNLEKMESELERCDENNIPVGIIISSTAKDLCDINNDVQYVKQIFSEHKVDHAVYLNVNEIVSNHDIDDETKAKIVREFLVNCSNNGIYVGLYGSDSNLCFLNGMSKGIFDINEYDAFVIMDGPKISYTGPYNTFMDYNGNVHSAYDICESVRENGLNDPNKFIEDAEYVITKDDSIEKIETMFNMPIEDILRYSGLTMEYFKPGVTLRVPRKSIIVEEAVSSETISDNIYAKEAGLFVGIDVSSWQDTINWDKLKTSVDFIIARTNQGTEYIDNMFETYAAGCEENGIALGAYCFNNYWGDLSYNEFIAKQKEQVSATIAALRGKKVEAPVYFDIEGGLDEGNLPVEYVKIMLDIWYTEITKAGYTPGIYSGQYDMNYIYKCVGSEVFDKFDIWVAGGFSYDRELNTRFARPSYDELTVLHSDITEKVNVVQVTQYCMGVGASNDAGYVDINFSKKQFGATKHSVIKDLPTGRFDSKRFYTSSNVDDDIAGFGGMGLICAGAALIVDNKRRKIKELKCVNENSGS